MITVHGIHNCDTCRKAWKWLQANGLEYRFHDLRRDGIDRETVDRWMDAVGDGQLVNRRGRSWRELDPDTRDALDETQLRSLLTEQPTLIKRPVVAWTNGAITVGFDPKAWEQRVGQAASMADGRYAGRCWRRASARRQCRHLLTRRPACDARGRPACAN